MNSDKCIIWGAGYCGGIALEAYGADHVICFGDSDERNIGNVRWGKQIISFDEMIRRSRTEGIRIIAASEDYAEEMEQTLLGEEIENYDVFVTECAKYIITDKELGINPLKKKYGGNAPSLVHDELKRFYNCHKGQRIFLIGNGPSLRTSDLEILHYNNEICFGFNNIHSIFSQTKWRPNYYGVADYYGFKIGKDKISHVPGIRFLWDLFAAVSPELREDANNVFFRYIRRGYSSSEIPLFSSDATQGLYLGYSSVYDIGLQMAAYMGASEIYLIGMDHEQPNKTSYEGNHFEGYLNKNETKESDIRFYPPENYKKGFEVDKINKAFEAAELYSQKHNFRIFNATRGGKLEIFERRNFDSLFS